MFDDTVNFLSFDTKEEASFVYSLITSDPAIEFLESIIFWDEKRPITTQILKRLSIHALAQELGRSSEYQDWMEVQTKHLTMPMEFGTSECMSQMISAP